MRRLPRRLQAPLSALARELLSVWYLDEFDFRYNNGFWEQRCCETLDGTTPNALAKRKGKVYQPDVMTETPKPTPQSGEPIIFKREDGNYRVSQITGEITEPLLIQDEITDLEDAKRVAKGVLTGGQIWYHDHRDPPDHLEPLQ